MNKLNIQIVTVIRKDDEDHFNLNSERWEILECDYAQTAIIVNDKVIYWADNIHNHPDEFINGFYKGLAVSNIDYEINKIIMYARDLYKMEGGKYGTF
jgi:hypothetical protein